LLGLKVCGLRLLAVATVEANSYEHAEEIALYDADVYWKEYDGDYDAEITVEEIDDV